MVKSYAHYVKEEGIHLLRKDGEELIQEKR